MSIKRKVDKLARLKKKIQALQEEYNELLQEVKDFAKENQLKEIEGYRYKIKFIDSSKTILPVEEVYKLVGKEKFFELISVQVTKAQKVIPKNEFYRIAKIVELPYYSARIYALKK